MAAFQIKRINPIDLESSRAIGVKLPFTGRAVFNQTFATKDAIKTNLTNYLLTGKGERYLNPSFGSNIQNLLFNQITEDLSSELDRTLRDEIRFYFPMIRVNDLGVTADPNMNMIQINIKYSILDTNIDDSLIVNIENPGQFGEIQ